MTKEPSIRKDNLIKPPIDQSTAIRLAEKYVRETPFPHYQGHIIQGIKHTGVKPAVLEIRTSIPLDVWEVNVQVKLSDLEKELRKIYTDGQLIVEPKSYEAGYITIRYSK